MRVWQWLPLVDRFLEKLFMTVLGHALGQKQATLKSLATRPHMPPVLEDFFDGANFFEGEHGTKPLYDQVYPSVLLVLSDKVSSCLHDPIGTKILVPF